MGNINVTKNGFQSIAAIIAGSGGELRLGMDRSTYVQNAESCVRQLQAAQAKRDRKARAAGGVPRSLDPPAPVPGDVDWSEVPVYSPASGGTDGKA